MSDNDVLRGRLMKILSSRLQAWLEDQNERRKDTGQPRLTQQKMAEELGIVNPAVIKSWLNGRSLPSSEHLYRFHARLGVSVHYLLGLDVIFEKGSGLNWTVTHLPINASETASGITELEKGIVLFQHIVKSKKSLTEIQKDERFKGLNPNEMGFLLRKALLSGAVRLTDVTLDKEKMRQLTNQYKGKLQKCFVTKLNLHPSMKSLRLSNVINVEATAFTAAHRAINQLTREVQSVGVVGGAVMSRCIDMLPFDSPSLRHVSWNSMLSTAGGGAPVGSTSNGLISRLVYAQPQSKGYRMPFINMSRRSDDYYSLTAKATHEVEELQTARDVLTRAKNVQTVFMSVGSKSNYTLPRDPGHVLATIYSSLPNEIKQLCCGDILLRLIDKEANRISDKVHQDQNDAVVYSIELDDLREIVNRGGEVWIVADKEEKADCIHAALSSGLANCLAINSDIASKLLQR